MEYTLKELEYWNEKIEAIAQDFGLDYYPQEFEIINYNEMIAYEVYVGMPSMYPHWSFGKGYEKLKTLYNYNLTGLPYEMVINSNPCIAYLMKDNTKLLQILTIAHVYGHNDFFKNNRLFKQGTNAEYTVEMFKNHADMIRSYINDPSIGYIEVEKMLNAAHALKFQTNRAVGFKYLTDEEIKKRKINDYKNDDLRDSIIIPKNKKEPPNLEKIPQEPVEDMLGFISKYGELEEWQKNIIDIVRKETMYFIPQIETKIMNEGWASFWHYNILKKLDLPPDLYIEFIKRHNDVIVPLQGSVNPYFLGFELYKNLAEKYGIEKIFEVREMERDSSFIRRYFTEELCNKLNLFEYIEKNRNIIIEEISDETGWKNIRDTLSNSCGVGSIPYIIITDCSRFDKTLTLEHVFDGRELQLKYTIETLKYVVDLWKHKVVLKTYMDGRKTKIVCDENKVIYS
ncbi:SpoVR family protein [Clostridium fermenticellae]|uniref:SpoVR family protein n=1 Tax=Clostridium fermenticellae TaxID=2068654 RepID=A0A386H4G5_9CLOT|nr:SpoVR family protein [Clostridium fermenticellae]AYD40556.1 SpoVR family protein [Clostridium fermenticellae]